MKKISFPLEVKLCLIALLAKKISLISKLFNIGNGSTWPGHIGLWLDKRLLVYFSGKIRKRIIVVAGTNGKTTTSKIIRHVLEKQGFKVLHNESGANLLNGIASIFLLHYSFWQKNIADFAIIESDEAAIPKLLESFGNENLTVVFLNLFRDQLDRYGEVDSIARIWQQAVKKLHGESIFILNSDDPQIALLGEDASCQKLFFGIEDKKLFLSGQEHATDSVYCLNCGAHLVYEGIYYSHLGIWSCAKCGVKRPKVELSKTKSVLPGLYNYYNTLAATLTLLSVGIPKTEAEKLLEDFKPAFGRQEETEFCGKKVKIFLSKNPVSMNESLKTIYNLQFTIYEKKTDIAYSSSVSGKYKPKVFADGSNNINRLILVLALNDNIPDGRDVSWIWDVDFENTVAFCQNIICCGQRGQDLAVRIKYALLQTGKKNYSEIIITENNFKKALHLAAKLTKPDETCYLLPTYSAMLEARKILGGKKIL